MSKLMSITIILMAVAFTGCAYTVSDYSNNGYPIRNLDRVDYKGKLNYIFGGIGQTRTIDAAGVCGSPDNVVQTEVVQTFADGFVAAITFGIYTPVSYRVYCKQRPAFRRR